MATPDKNVTHNNTRENNTERERAQSLEAWCRPETSFIKEAPLGKGEARVQPMSREEAAEAKVHADRFDRFKRLSRLNENIGKSDQEIWELGRMKRLFVFTCLYPPLVLLIYTAADNALSEGLPGVGFLSWLLAIAYAVAVVPAWLLAGFDWALSDRPLYVRLLAIMPVSAILAELVARYLSQPHFDVPVAIGGAIPAAVCSWLSDKSMRSKN